MRHEEQRTRGLEDGARGVRVGRTSRIVCVVLVSVLALGACGKRQTGTVSSVTGSTGTGSTGSSGDKNVGAWARPFNGGGVELSGLSELKAQGTTFPLYLPNTSAPMKVFVPPTPSGGEMTTPPSLSSTIRRTASSGWASQLLISKLLPNNKPIPSDWISTSRPSPRTVSLTFMGRQRL